VKKQTKILATISDMRCSEDFLRSLHEAGMDGVRMNTAHQSLDDTMRVVQSVRNISKKIPLVLDTKGPEIRTTKKIADIIVKAGDKIKVKGDPDKESSRELLHVTYPAFARDVAVGTRILIDDGAVSLVAEQKDGDTLICVVENDGEIGSKKSVNVPGVPIKLPSLSSKDIDFVNFAIEHEIDFIAHSFVRNQQDVIDIQKLLDARGSKCQIIAKIENQEGVDNIDEILEHVYGVMVARGDMGIEIPAEHVPSIQKMIIRKCREKKKMVITATQMLHTMMENPRPTRAEVSDIANAVYDGTDCLMLSGETANGKYPLEAVTIMAKIAKATEEHNVGLTPIDIVHSTNEIPAFLAEKAVEACQKLPIKGIVTDTMTGRTARYISAFRGTQPIYVQCYDEDVMRRLALTYGAIPFYLPEERDTAYFVRVTLSALLADKELGEKDAVLILAGRFGPSTGASFMEISTVEDQLKK
jgi:pyruvate kinase